MTVPSNTNLSAGDIIECEFRSCYWERRTRSFRKWSYMIKELCHHFDAQGSYTSMTLVRDTFGASNQITRYNDRRIITKN